MIQQPQDRTYTANHSTIRLQYNPQFARLRQADIDKAQKFIDSECIRQMQPYIPRLNGVLSRSATLSTRIGSGVIEYNVPYARYQYYGKLMVSSITGSAYSKGEKKILTDVDLKYTKTNPKAGAYWFERMKTDKKSSILRGAAAVIQIRGDSG